jgi:tellurite resistance protein TerC
VLEISGLTWGVTIALIVGLLALDLVLAAVRPHRVGFREATAWSVFYVAVAIGFGVWFAMAYGGDAGTSTSPATSSRRASRSTTCSSS